MEDSGKRYVNKNKDGFDSYEAKEKERIELARGKRKKRIRNRRIFSLLFIVLLILCVGIIVIRTPLFNVDSIMIEGNSLVSDEEILAAVKMSEGENIFSHTEKYMESKLSLLPYISKAEVEKILPSKVRITIHEENEYAVVEFKDEKITCDKNGKSVKIVDGDIKEGLVIIRGGSPGEFNTGDYIKLSDNESTDNFYKCLSILTDYGLTGVICADMSDVYNVVLTLTPNLVIKLGELGSEDELSYKMAYIREVMNNLPQNISGIIDATNIEAGVSYRTGEFEYDTSGAEEEEENAKAEGEEEQEKTEE